MTRKKSTAGNYAKFRDVVLPEKWKGFFFVFCSEHEGKMWLMSAEEFAHEAEGKTVINFLGKHRGVSGAYKARDFSRLKREQ